jgi:hypothetical protein
MKPVSETKMTDVGIIVDINPVDINIDMLIYRLEFYKNC